MTTRLDAVREADVVVLGAGAAGLSVALGLAGRRVDLLAKRPLGRTGNSPLAQGGVAGALGPGDSPALHAADTLAVAGELGDPEAVARLTEEGPERLAQLRRPGRALRPRRRSASSISRARRRTPAPASCTPGTPREPRSCALSGRRSPGGAASASSSARSPSTWCSTAGVSPASSPGTTDGALVLHRARAVVLATGGIGRVFARTTNPPEATGDGLALAWRAGARLADVELVQFHPTALDVRRRPDAAAHRGVARRRGRPRGPRTADDSWPTPVRRASCCPATSSRARCGPRSPRAAARSWTRARRWGSRSRSGSRPCSRPAGGTASTRAWSRSPWPRPRTTTWAAWTWTSTAGRASPASGPRARWRAPGSTARTAWPATRCSRLSCSARASHGASPRPCPT